MINQTRLETLKEEIGEDDFAEVLEMFIEEVEDVIGRLKTDPDPAEFEADLHFLKSSALNLGFDAMSQICGTGEKEAAQGHFDPAGLTQVFETFAASKSELQSLPL